MPSIVRRALAIINEQLAKQALGKMYKAPAYSNNSLNDVIEQGTKNNGCCCDSFDS